MLSPVLRIISGLLPLFSRLQFRHDKIPHIHYDILFNQWKLFPAIVIAIIALWKLKTIMTHSQVLPYYRLINSNAVTYSSPYFCQTILLMRSFNVIPLAWSCTNKRENWLTENVHEENFGGSGDIFQRTWFPENRTILLECSRTRNQNIFTMACMGTHNSNDVLDGF